MKVADPTMIAPRPARWLQVAVVGLVLAPLGACLCGFAHLGGFDGYSRQDSTKNTLMTVETGLKLYYARHHYYPETSPGLAALVSEHMLDRMPKDGWGNELVYERVEGAYRIFSLGADGVPGGKGDNADISSEDLKESK